MLLEKLTCKVCSKEITKYSKSGMCKSCQTKLRFSIPENNPMFGIHRYGENSPHYKNGISLEKHYCIDCNKEIKRFKSERCIKCSHKNRIHKSDCGCASCKAKRGETKGINNPNYKENKDFRPYPLGWSNTYKEQIRFRDNYTCQNCGVPEVECKVKLHVHHIDYCKSNLDPNNLVSLCHNCHAKTTVSKPEKVRYWIEYYRRI